MSLSQGESRRTPTSFNTFEYCTEPGEDCYKMARTSMDLKELIKTFAYNNVVKQLMQNLLVKIENNSLLIDTEWFPFH